MLKLYDLPRGPFVSLSLALLANSFSITMLFPFAVFMCRDFHVTDNNKHIGYFAGALAAAFMLGRFLSSFTLGKLADTYGRKLVLRLGLWSIVVTSIWFGIAPTYSWAITARFFAGLLNGIDCI